MAAIRSRRRDAATEDERESGVGEGRPEYVVGHVLPLPVLNLSGLFQDGQYDGRFPTPLLLAATDETRDVVPSASVSSAL